MPPHSTAPLSTAVGIAICTLPEELTPRWDKQPLGDQMVTDVASLLEPDNGWQCKSHFYLFDSIAHCILDTVPGLSVGLATLSITCRAQDVLVSSILQFNLHMIGHVL